MPDLVLAALRTPKLQFEELATLRFFADGPDVPDELLAARDEGQTLIFCGSGVSLARAGLPDFFGLANDVIEGLGDAGASRARTVIKAAQSVGRIDGVGGLVAADRVFSLLEQEFSSDKIRRAVAAAPQASGLSGNGYGNCSRS